MSKNVFADLGFDRPEEELLKAQIVVMLRGTIERKKLTQSEAAKRLGLAQSDVSRLVNGKIAGYSLDRMLGFLASLGLDVEIRTRPVRGRPGRITLAA